MRRFTRRPFRRRFFRRPTQWVGGVTWEWKFSIFPMQPVWDASGTIVCKTARVPFLPNDDIIKEVGDGYTLLRVVGHVWPVVTATVQERPVLPPQGAQLRCSIERERLYPQVTQDEQLAAGGTVGTQQKSHLFSAAELGDEEIMWTRHYYQWARAAFSDPLPFEIGSTFDGYNWFNDQQTAIADGNNIVDLGSERRWGDSVRDYDLDLRCRRKVTVDDVPFLFVDAVGIDGQPFPDNSFHDLHLNGFLRILVRKGR